MQPFYVEEYWALSNQIGHSLGAMRIARIIPSFGETFGPSILTGEHLERGRENARKMIEWCKQVHLPMARLVAVAVRCAFER